MQYLDGRHILLNLNIYSSGVVGEMPKCGIEDLTCIKQIEPPTAPSSPSTTILYIAKITQLTNLRYTAYMEKPKYGPAPQLIMMFIALRGTQTVCLHRGRSLCSTPWSA
jgi:hypothetical protein